MYVGLSRQGRGSKATQWRLFGRTRFDRLSTSFESLRVSSLVYHHAIAQLNGWGVI